MQIIPKIFIFFPNPKKNEYPDPDKQSCCLRLRETIKGRQSINPRVYEPNFKEVEFR